MENTCVPENEVGMWQWLFGKSITSIALRNSGSNDGFVGIAAPSLARVLPGDNLFLAVLTEPEIVVNLFSQNCEMKSSCTIQKKKLLADS
ncbi:hypothetical protein V6N12_038339 [Hibiscus sabdariffa]|uniref:Uncharacterized protein n=1 Tax=Hibiscus sabdariffa TaxID=183260 RepID=A0ABR2BGQ6_9ROSI